MTAMERTHCAARDTADSRRRPVVVVELVATIALAFSTLIAVAAISIGMARADSLTCVSLVALCQ